MKMKLYLTMLTFGMIVALAGLPPPGFSKAVDKHVSSVSGMPSFEAYAVVPMEQPAFDVIDVVYLNVDRCIEQKLPVATEINLLAGQHSRCCRTAGKVYSEKHNQGITDPPKLC